MPSNERANKRKEKQNKKEKTKRIIIWVLIAVVVLVLFIMKICEVDFTTIKNKFTSNTSISSISDNGYPYTLDMSKKADVNIVNDKLAILTDVCVSVINPNNAEKTYSFDHGYTTPVLTSAGNYLCTYDEGGTRIRLDTTSDNLFEKTTDKNIICADVSNNGTIAYATFGDDVKSILYVVSSKANKKMELSVNDGYITCVALNSKGTKCIYTTVKSENADLITTVHTITVGKTEDTATFDYTNSNILNITYSSGDKAYVIGNDFLSIIKSQNIEDKIYEKGSINCLNYCFTSSNELILNYSEYVNSTDSKLAFVRSNGKIKNDFAIDEIPKYISSNSNEITVLYSNRFTVYSLTSGEEKSSTNCDSSISSVHTLSSKNYVLYGQYIDIIE